MLALHVEHNKTRRAIAHALETSVARSLADLNAPKQERSLSHYSAPTIDETLTLLQRLNAAGNYRWIAFTQQEWKVLRDATAVRAREIAVEKSCGIISNPLWLGIELPKLERRFDGEIEAALEVFGLYRRDEVNIQVDIEAPPKAP